MRSVPALAAITALAVLAVAPAAHADDAIGVTPGPTNVAAYGGEMAWSVYDAGSKTYKLVLRDSSGKVSTARVKGSPAPLEVSLGPDSKGRVVALYVRCTSAASGPNDVSNGCDAYRLQISSGTEAKLSFSSPHDDESWPAQWKDQFVFGRSLTTTSGNATSRCDVPYRRAVSGGSSQRMDRGRCGAIGGLALRGTVVGETVQASGNSQVRLLSTKGGPVTVAASQNFGEEANLFGGPALDSTYVYATRYGVNPAPTFIRIKRDGLKKQEVPAHLALTGSIAIDGATISYVDEMGGDKGSNCTSISPCRVVRSPSSPFGGAKRVLPPTLTLLGPAGTQVLGAPVPADQPLAMHGALTRATVTSGNITGSQPVAGQALQLLIAVGAQGAVPYTPTGITTTTAADGTFSVAGTPPIPPVFGYGVTTGGTVPTVSDQLFGNASVTITATPSATTVTAGTAVTFTGTLSPAQPGRTDVKIQRLTSHTCQTAQSGQQVCNDTVAEATGAATLAAPDGASYTATVPIAQTGTYTAVVPFISGNFTVYAGRSAGVAITVSG